jgi:uncharacterized protein YbjT (DUF2867 family)
MNKEDEKILVAGATGTVGSEVVKRLLSITTADSVRAAVHSKSKAEEISQYTKKGIEIVELDYMKPETISEALIDIDKLFLQTIPVPQITDVCYSIVKEAKKNNVNYIVKLSAMGADSQSGSTILRLHGAEEQIIKESGIPYTFLRPTAFMQNFMTQFGQTIKTQNVFYVPAGDAKMSFVDARDIGAIAAKMLINGNEDENKYHINKVYDITGQAALSYSQAAEILSKETGKKISYMDITEDAARKAMKEIGMNDWSIDILIELFRTIKTGYGVETTTAVEHITGRKPTSFERFAKDYAEVFR